MNKARRAQLTACLSTIEKMIAEIEAIKEVEEAVLENMPDNFQFGEQGELVEEGIEYLEDAITGLEKAQNNLQFAIMG